MKRAIGKRVNDVRRRPDPQGLPVKYESSWISQIGSLCVRTMRQKRGKLLDFAALQQLAVMIFISCVFWFRMEMTESTIGDRLGALFFFNLYWSIVSIFSTLFAFPSERAVLNKDRAGGAYRLSAYYTAKTLVETPADCIYPATFSLLVYWMVGLNSTARAYVIFVILLLVSALTSQSFGLAISAAVPSLQRAQVLATCFVLASMLMAGYYVNSGNIPDFIRPLRFLSYMKYSYEAFVLNEVSGQKYGCVAQGLTHSIYSQKGAKCPVESQNVLDGAGIDGNFSIIGNIGVLFLCNIVVRLVGYLSLKHMNIHHKPKSRKA
jgi:ABC-2 type transporter